MSFHSVESKLKELIKNDMANIDHELVMVSFEYEDHWPGSKSDLSAVYNKFICPFHLEDSHPQLHPELGCWLFSCGCSSSSILSAHKLKDEPKKFLSATWRKRIY